jgi:hypothetical protein
MRLFGYITEGVMALGLLKATFMLRADVAHAKELNARELSWESIMQLEEVVGG